MWFLVFGPHRCRKTSPHIKITPTWLVWSDKHCKEKWSPHTYNCCPLNNNLPPTRHANTQEQVRFKRTPRLKSDTPTASLLTSSVFCLIYWENRIYKALLNPEMIFKKHLFFAIICVFNLQPFVHNWAYGFISGFNFLNLAKFCGVTLSFQTRLYAFIYILLYFLTGEISLCPFFPLWVELLWPCFYLGCLFWEREPDFNVKLHHSVELGNRKKNKMEN